MAYLVPLSTAMRPELEENVTLQIRGARGNHAFGAYATRNLVVHSLVLHTAGLFAFLDAGCFASTYLVSCLPINPSCLGCVPMYPAHTSRAIS